MRRPILEGTDDEDDKDNVTVKSMLISMVRVRIFYPRECTEMIELNNIDAFSIVEINDMSSDWLGCLFCHSFVFY